MEISTTKQKLARFGRAMALMLNRSMMYQKNHPMVKNSIIEVRNSAERLFENISPLVFILNRNQFYVDEEPLDPRMNIKRIADLFEKNGIQSVSFEDGLTTSELEIFVDVFSTLTTIKDAESIKRALISKGVYNVQVNHVLYKKVTEDDQIISRDALKDVTPNLEEDDQESRKKFMETLLESVLTDEFAKTLSIQSLVTNPKALSQSMIQADLASADITLAEPEEHQTVYDLEMDADGTDSAGGSGDTATGPDGSGSGAGPGGSGPGAGAGGLGADPGGGGPGPGAGGLGAGPGGGGPGPGAGGLGADPGGGGPGPGAGGLGAGPGGGGPGPGGGGTGTGPATGRLKAAPGAGATEPAHDAVRSGAGPAGAASDTNTKTGTATTTAGALAGTKPASAQPPGHGPMLMHQLDMMHLEVEKHLQGQGEVSLEALANAIFEMKKELFEGIETQKALGVAYTNEAQIIQKANQLTDKVILELINEEYQSSPQLPAKRLAMIITRLVPEAKDLKRLLPQIKQVLVNAGMPLADYLDLVQELKNELQSDELARILQESSDTIGVDSQDLINEIKENPSQAAKLIYLSSEIKKGTGDESALSDILVDYVEQMARDAAEDNADKDGEHLEKVVSNVESTIIQQLGKMNVNSDVLLKMEDRINQRMESILDQIRVEWLRKQSATKKVERKSLSVLQTLEHSVGDDEELGEILKTIRSKVGDGGIDENNFSQIHAEINLQKERIKAEIEDLELPEGVLNPNELIFVLDKEIARANRYSAPFSALAFSFVKAKPAMTSLKKVITTEAVMAAALEKLTTTIREVDYIGQIGKNKMVALLPMIAQQDAKRALNRVLSVFHAKPLDVHGVPVQLRVAGVVSTYDAGRKLDSHAFAKQLSNQLMDMVARVKSIQVLF